MMRRTVLLLATTALTLIAAGGMALAATLITCSTDPCDGTADDDVITGTLNAETINGKAGSDEISALDANDTLNGDAGNDTMLGEDGNDTMDGGDGNDRYRFSDNFGADRIEADSSGVDTIDLSGISIPDGTNSSTNGISVDLQGPDPLCFSTQPRCISLGGEFIENLVGTPFGDPHLIGNSLENNISGGDGNDQLYGRAANDNLQGGSGSDILIGEAGNDQLDGGETNDQYNLTSNWGSDTVLDPNTASSNPAYLAWVAADFSNPPTVPLVFNLQSGPGPEVTDGNGNTMNWEGNAIARAAGGPAGDTLIQNSSSNTMNGYGGADTYKGYGPGGPSSGFDHILEVDRSTASDTLDLTNFNVADISKWEVGAATPGGTANDKSLLITFADGSKIQIYSYFDFTGAADVCTSKQGKWYMEKIPFKDDDNVDFAQVKSLLGCPTSDTTPPDPPVITSPANNTIDKDGILTLSGTAEASSTVELFEGPSSKGTATTNASGNWSKTLPPVGDGTYTYTAVARDSAGNTSDPSSPLTVEVKIPPVITNVSPPDQAPSVPLNTSVEATFSEAMDASTSDGDASTINGNTFTLTKPDGPDADSNPDPVAGVVSYDSPTKKATLDPTADLDHNTTYTATVTTGAEDLAGNQLDQEPITSGNQPKSWSFTTAAAPPPDTSQPTVQFVSPSDGARGVLRTTMVTALFSEDVYGVTVETFMLGKGNLLSSQLTSATKIASATTVSFEPTTKTATLDPYGSGTTRLARCQWYTAKVTSGIENTAHNPAIEKLWSFKTKGC